MISTDIHSFNLSEITLEDPYMINAFNKETAYLTSFDTDKLLAGFRETAGLDMKGAVRYGGWESLLIGGHTLGHYITACVNAYETPNCDSNSRRVLLNILYELAVGLKECQDATGTGFIFGAVLLDKDNIEKQFDNVEVGAANLFTESWVPWYTLHKLFEGLTRLAEFESDLSDCPGVDPKVGLISQTALTITSRLADWVYRRASSWSEETHSVVLGIEYGGMNDCLYDVYKLTGKEEHLKAARLFDDTALFARISNAGPNDNILNNLHANTTIPKFIGALNRYTVTGETEYLHYAEAFFKLVANSHSYITGNNSEWEHFGLDRILDAERTNCNCETCNAYNMLKLAKLLYTVTGNASYLDWYENTFINTILSSQNPETGMTTYFQPMASGYFKTYSERFTKFWCCTGSGMENFSKLGESLFYRTNDAVIIAQYFSSKLSSSGISLEVLADLEASDTVNITVSRAYEGRLLFRLPCWLKQPAEITVNGKPVDYRVVGAVCDEVLPNCRDYLKTFGYAEISGSFDAGTLITLKLPMCVNAFNLPDNTSAYGFKYGPYVLSACLGTDNMVTGTTGVDVTIAAEKVLSDKYVPSGSETVTVLTESVEQFIKDINEHMLKDQSEQLSFTLCMTDALLKYIPHYRQHKERYGLYFTFRSI